MARILVIDDDSAIGTTVETLLAQAGHETVVAESGREGLELADGGGFDLLIVDIFMPGMDGLETISQVRKGHPSVPIIVMSGHDFRTSAGAAPNFLAMAMKLGAAGILRKPFKARELLASVDTALAKKPPVKPR